MPNTPIYLDYNATAPVKKPVADAVYAALNAPQNASSVHAFGRAAHQHITHARQHIAHAVGASDAYQVIFTSSGTEANNMILHGLADTTPVVAATEHISVLKPAGETAQLIPVDENGIVRLDALEAALNNTPGKALVSVMLANNETGVIQPIAEIAERVYAHGGYIHCDAAQAFGKIPVDIQALNVDALTLSAHKCGGPQGAAALIIKKGLPLTALLTGGGQEANYRAGTENTAAIMGFGVAVAHIQENLDATSDIAALRDLLEQEILHYAPEATIYGTQAPRLPNTSNIMMPYMQNETQLIAFDLEGIAVSAGSACSSGKVGTSHVLRAMGVEEKHARCAIRVSLGPETTHHEIERFLHAWKMLHDRAQAKQQHSPERAAA